MKTDAAALFQAIRDAGEISPEVEKALGDVLDGFVRTFA